jgi:DNA-directed RNA polymerase subunit M/transcription elongation factor TFIIS
MCSIIKEMIIKFCKICKEILTTKEYEKSDICTKCQEEERIRELNRYQEDWA